jgi:hypothetical protein
VSIDGPGREQLRTLAARLKDAGEEGKGFRRELMKQISAAAEPLAREISSLAHLKPYMPDRYAAVLAGDISVTAQKIFARDPRVSVRAKGRQHKRKVRLVDQGRLNHPVFAEGPRKTWEWVNGQTDGMKPGFFREPCEKAAPEIRQHVLAAMDETAGKITRG